MLSSVDMDIFMEIYNRLVPHIYIPEPGVMREIIEMLGLNEKEKSMELLPQFLSQIIRFDMLDRHMIMKHAFKIMVSHKEIPNKFSSVPQQYSNFAWTLWTRIQVDIIIYTYIKMNYRLRQLTFFLLCRK